VDAHDEKVWGCTQGNVWMHTTECMDACDGEQMHVGHAHEDMEACNGGRCMRHDGAQDIIVLNPEADGCV
jgi:hypothetical protein